MKRGDGNLCQWAPIGRICCFDEKNCTCISTDFAAEEEQEDNSVTDGERVVIGGLLVNKIVKTTKIIR